MAKKQKPLKGKALADARRRRQELAQSEVKFKAQQRPGDLDPANDTGMFYQGPAGQMGNDNFDDKGAPKAKIPGMPKWKAELYEDPAYAAFDRNFEYNRSKVQDSFINLKNRLKRDLLRQDTRYDQQRVEGERGIDRSMENRGLYRSGQRHVGIGRMNNKIDFEREHFISGQGEAREEGRRAKQDAIGSLKRQRAEERINARSRLTDRDATTKYGI